MKTGELMPVERRRTYIGAIGGAIAMFDNGSGPIGNPQQKREEPRPTQALVDERMYVRFSLERLLPCHLLVTVIAGPRAGKTTAAAANLTYAYFKDQHVR